MVLSLVRSPKVCQPDGLVSSDNLSHIQSIGIISAAGLIGGMISSAETHQETKKDKRHTALTTRMAVYLRENTMHGHNMLHYITSPRLIAGTAEMDYEGSFTSQTSVSMDDEDPNSKTEHDKHILEN